MTLAASNPKISQLRRLIGRRSSRYDLGVLVVEGPHAVADAVRAGAEVREVFIGEDASEQLIDVANLSSVQPTQVRAGVLERVLSSTSPQPLAAVVAWKPTPLEQIIVTANTGGGGLVLVLVDVADPGNVGTALRSAEAAGATGVAVTGSSADVSSPKVVRAAAGATFRLPVAVESMATDALQQVRAHGIITWALLPTSGESLHQAALVGPVAIVVGNEAHGLSPEVVDACDLRLSIPMAGEAESLNAAMAATVALFESARQRRAR